MTAVSCSIEWTSSMAAIVDPRQGLTIGIARNGEDVPSFVNRPLRALVDTHPGLPGVAVSLKQVDGPRRHLDATPSVDAHVGGTASPGPWEYR